MAFQSKKLTYTHQDIEAFHNKDLLIVKQVCINAIASIHQSDKAFSIDNMTSEAEQLLSWFYPQGTKYDCGNSYCEICHSELVEKHKKEHHIFVSKEEGIPFKS